MQPTDLPLLVASDAFSSGPEPEPLDRLRMQKAIFLLGMEGPQGWKELFEFEPWDWGPYSRALAAEVRSLLKEGLLEEDVLPGQRYPRYRTTSLGNERVQSVVVELEDSKSGFIRLVREYVTSRSFDQLLREVYAAYPQYATRSRFVR